MSIVKEAKRVKFGQSLISFDTQATNAINQLKGIKLNLANMKVSMHSDENFTSNDEAEVDLVITKIDASLDKILKG